MFLIMFSCLIEEFLGRNGIETEARLTTEVGTLRRNIMVVVFFYVFTQLFKWCYIMKPFESFSKAYFRCTELVDKIQ